MVAENEMEMACRAAKGPLGDSFPNGVFCRYHLVWQHPEDLG